MNEELKQRIKKKLDLYRREAIEEYSKYGINLIIKDFISIKRTKALLKYIVKDKLNSYLPFYKELLLDFDEEVIKKLLLQWINQGKYTFLIFFHEKSECTGAIKIKKDIFIRNFDSVTDATSFFTNKCSSHISAALSGRAKTAYGYIWKYAEEE